MAYAGAYYQRQRSAAAQAACKQWGGRIAVVVAVIAALGLMYSYAPKWGKRSRAAVIPQYSTGLIPGKTSTEQDRRALRNRAGAAAGAGGSEYDDDYAAASDDDAYYNDLEAEFRRAVERRRAAGKATRHDAGADEEDEEGAEAAPAGGKRRRGGKSAAAAAGKKGTGKGTGKKTSVAEGLPPWASTSAGKKKKRPAEAEEEGEAEAGEEAAPAPVVAPSASPSPAATPSPTPKPDLSALKKQLVRPPRDAAWAAEQRPLDDNGAERGVTSHKFEELTIKSLNPPRPFTEMTTDPLEMLELQSRLVIGVGMGVHSGHTDVAGKGLVSLPVFNTLLPTFLVTAQPTYIYRFYFAFDHNDPVYESGDWRGKIEREFYRLVAEEDKKRWHPAGYVPGETIDGSTLIATMHFVHCDYAAKPAWAHSDAMMAAFKEGADYGFRTNDDTAFPTVPDWADRMIGDLRGRPETNLGVTGPGCDAGANWILTHDFTHKTHAVIFGFHYPRSLPDWSSDDWITIVYRQYGVLMTRRDDAKVEHRLHGTRYNPQDRGTRLAALNAELENGAALIDAYTKERWNVVIPHEKQHITCC